MVTCRLPELASSFVVLHVQWLSDVLLVLLSPLKDITQEEGVLVSQDGLRRVWHEKGIVEDAAVAEELLKVLPELHVHLARQRPGQSDRCFFVPQRLPKVLPEGLSDAFRDCVALPHAGLRARPLEEDGRRGRRRGQLQHRNLLDAFTFSQLQSFLACHKGVHLLVRAVTPTCCLVQPGGLPGLPCCVMATDGHTLGVSLLADKELLVDSEATPLAELRAEIAPLQGGVEWWSALREVMVYVDMFLSEEHERLRAELSPLLLCPSCVRLGVAAGGEGRDASLLLVPGSFSMAELALEERGDVFVCSIPLVFSVHNLSLLWCSR